MSKSKKFLLATAVVIVLYGIYTLGWNVGYAAGKTPNTTTNNSSAAVAPVSPPTVAEISADVNTERTKAGEPPLIEDPALDASALAKCNDMITFNYRAHISPTGVTWQSFFASQLQTDHIGENLSEYYQDSNSAVQGWMGSPEHRANILDATFNHVGYAVCGTENKSNYIVQHFAEE